MESSMIINGDMLKESDIMYKKPSINNNGGKAVGILNSKSKKSVFISTPLMLTWGINEYVMIKLEQNLMIWLSSSQMMNITILNVFHSLRICRL